jgi:hypothetical protein
MASKMRNEKLELAKRQTAIRTPPPTVAIFLQPIHGPLFNVTARSRQVQAKC